MTMTNLHSDTNTYRMTAYVICKGNFNFACATSYTDVFYNLPTDTSTASMVVNETVPAISLPSILDPVIIQWLKT